MDHPTFAQLLGNYGEFVGAIAVVVTLIYLAVQIRANTQATQRQSLDDTIDRVVGWAARVVSSPEYIGCWIKGSESFHNLSVEDQLRFATLNMEIFGAAETSLEAAKFGGVKPETVGAVEGFIGQLSLNHGVSEWWEINGRSLFAADFASQVDRISAHARASRDSVSAILPFQIPSG